VDPTALDAFLGMVYRSEKAGFLARNGNWWHRGLNNRWVIEESGEVSAYCGVIPTTLQVAGERIEAAWWVDLVVAPERRGEGLQSIFDAQVRATAPLIVGFPNALAAAIHRRHCWGVRNDLEVRMLPLRPFEIIARRARSGPAGHIERIAAVVAAPYARRLRQKLESFEPRFSRLIDRPRAEELATVFAEGSDRTSTTTFRDAEYLAWRYLESPFRDKLVVIVGGEDSAAEVAAVLRILARANGTVARILDLFGQLEKERVVRDVLLMVSKVAYSAGAIQVTSMSANRSLSRTLRSIGFTLKSRARFCWLSGDRELQERIGVAPLHLALGDSDNDEP
jgi:hypothetical protein